jgi:hypothetical protein
MTSYIDVTGRWKSRPEGSDALGGRLARWFASLADIDPLFSHWIRGGMRHRSVVPQIVTLPPDVTQFRDWIAENPVFETREGRKQQVGYSINAMTRRTDPIRANLWLSASGKQSPDRFDNRIGITLFPPVDETQKLIALVRATLLASATAWDCDWAGVAAGEYGGAGHQPGAPLPRFQSGWMVYLDQTLAGHLRKPEDIVAERLASGAILLTSVSDAIFDRRNAIHLTAARRLQTALDPLNAK